ncbi:extracellular solute-binding protein [Actinospica sp. MGRD01-02]|uniref:Extracellular solute-binding protein n=1 Tax=Actinospica acidithermotolerans TaxID=2828514 RepID=A0A941E9N4_9ACTN|nr:extracellular solute-binding protein [Actinospica acidithermotolerans]MBR7825099.1 extracellular solute-binding protein [Actinospica acidithermotolerans]
MRMPGKAVLAGGTALAVCAALAACSTGTSAPASSATTLSAPESVASLQQKAASEKGLVVYANVPNQYFQPVIAAFNKQYPKIQVQVTTLDDHAIFSKYEAEAAQGARTADLLVASAPASWVEAEQNGVPAAVTPAGLGAFPSWVNQGHGVYVMSAEPMLLGYNEKLLSASQVPHTWSQLAADAKADPSRYRMVSYPITNTLDYAGVYGLEHLMGGEKTMNIFAALAPVTTTYNEGLDQLQQVVRGSASLSYMTSGLAQGALSQYKGLAGYTFMQDGTPLVPRAVSVTAKASSPASAQLFLDFLYSEAGQQALCAGGFEATMNGFQPANGCTASLTSLAKEVPASSTYLVPIDQAVLDQQPEITSEWNRVFHR